MVRMVCGMWCAVCGAWRVVYGVSLQVDKLYASAIGKPAGDTLLRETQAEVNRVVQAFEVCQKARAQSGLSEVKAVFDMGI